MIRADLFNLLLKIAADRRSTFPEEELTAFWPMSGQNWRHELMIVGRAVNGWTDPWHPASVVDAARRSQIALMTRSVSDGDGSECSMLWVSKSWGKGEPYNTRRSAFWRVVRLAVGELGICDTSLAIWPSSITWTNLYKLSPAAGGNPSSALIRLQHEICVELLRQEVDDYRPNRVLFLTGTDWAEPFLQQLGTFEVRWNGLGSVQMAGILQSKGFSSNVSVVVAQHPQGKGDSTYIDGLREAWAACVAC